jgi:hypothetical protein
VAGPSELCGLRARQVSVHSPGPMSARVSPRARVWLRQTHMGFCTGERGDLSLRGSVLTEPRPSSNHAGGRRQTTCARAAAMPTLGTLILRHNPQARGLTPCRRGQMLQPWHLPQPQLPAAYLLSVSMADRHGWVIHTAVPRLPDL